MTLSTKPAYRAVAIGATAGALLVGAFALGTTRGSTASAATGSTASATGSTARHDAQLTASSGSARITVTGTGTVTGTPNQLVLSMGVQVSAASVTGALQQADQAVNRVTAALRRDGVAAADIQTSDLSVQPNYRGNSQTPDGYGVAESLSATLRDIATAGAQISAAVRAGGNATTVDGISLNLTDDSGLLAAARSAAIADARTKAGQYARAIGQPLGGVLSITDQAQQNPLPVFAPNAAPSAAKAAVPISAGSQQLSVAVTVVFAVA
jgi:uncharacterized protein YggE